MRKFYLFFGVLILTARILLGQDIVATTSVLSSVIKEVIKDKLTVETLVPSGYCPGHFDIKGSHLLSIEKSGLLFAQGFEPYLEPRCRIHWAPTIACISAHHLFPRLPP